MSARPLILMFDDHGLEQLHDLSAFPEECEKNVFAKLAGKAESNTKFPNVQIMQLRATYNSHRNYHIYGIKMPMEITDKMIEEQLLLESASNLRDLIKRRGVSLY